MRGASVDLNTSTSSRRSGDRQYVLGVGATWRLNRSGMAVAGGGSGRDSCAEAACAPQTRSSAAAAAATLAVGRRELRETVIMVFSARRLAPATSSGA